MISEPAQKCENQAIFKQNYTLELFIALEMVYYCCFSLGGNLENLDLLKKSFITSTTGKQRRGKEKHAEALKQNSICLIF